MVICLERGADLHVVQLMPLPLTVVVLGHKAAVFWWRRWVVLGSYIDILRLAHGRYSRCYSLGGGSDAVSGYHSMLAVFFTLY